MRRLLGTSDEVPNPIGGIDYARTTTTHRRLFTTAKGYLGIGPHLRGHGWQLHEESFILPGDQTPFLLRQAGERCVPGHRVQLCCHLAGDCYVHGFMDREGVKDLKHGNRNFSPFKSCSSLKCSALGKFSRRIYEPVMSELNTIFARVQIVKHVYSHCYAAGIKIPSLLKLKQMLDRLHIYSVCTYVRF